MAVSTYGGGMKSLALVGVLAVVAACGPRMSIADQCSQYGFYAGTAAHANCQMQLTIADENLQQQRSANLSRMGMQMMQPPPAPASGMTTYRMPSGNTMTCSRFGNMVNCF